MYNTYPLKFLSLSSPIYQGKLDKLHGECLLAMGDVGRIITCIKT